jgi:hypothetical protein
MQKQLPSRPSLEQLKKQAKSILKGHQSANPEVLREIQEHHPRWRSASDAAIQRAGFTLTDAQLVVANQYGFESWAKLKAHVARFQTASSSDAEVNELRSAAGRVVEALIQAGASVDVRDDPKTSIDSTFGYTPLHAAAFH